MVNASPVPSSSPSSCLACKVAIKNPKEFACGACRKETRDGLAGLETFEQVSKFQCQGHGPEKKKNLTRMRSSWYELVPRTVTVFNWERKITLWFDNGCIICADEVRKECDARNRRLGKQEKQHVARNETLVQKCARVIAMDPGLLLVAATHNPPVEEHLWEIIHKQVPVAMSNKYKEALEESLKANDSPWMYATIGTVFSRFVGGGNKRRRI